MKGEASTLCPLDCVHHVIVTTSLLLTEVQDREMTVTVEIASSNKNTVQGENGCCINRRLELNLYCSFSP